MIRAGMTVREAAEEWVREFNAIPQEMIDKLWRLEPDRWREVTTPATGRAVYVYNLPEDCGSLEHSGEIVKYDEEADAWEVELADGMKTLVEEEGMEIEYDGSLPAWGTMWSFDDPCDNYWLEKMGGVRIMSECGFRVYESDDYSFYFGIDGAGYSFYEEHWCPLYRARGLQWHDPKAEEECQMKGRGYHQGKLGDKTYWMDGDNNVIKEAI